MYKKRFSYIVLAIIVLAVSAGCKQETTKQQYDTFEVDMPGTPVHNYVEFPLEEWGTTLPMDTYEVMLGEDEYFSVSKVQWADTLQKLREKFAELGEEWDDDELYATISANFFAQIVNNGKAAGSAEETLLDNRKAYRYAISSLDDPQTGESIVSGEGKGHFIMIPTDASLYVLSYYANDETYDQQREQDMIDSFKIYE